MLFKLRLMFEAVLEFGAHVQKNKLSPVNRGFGMLKLFHNPTEAWGIVKDHALHGLIIRCALPRHGDAVLANIHFGCTPYQATSWFI